MCVCLAVCVCVCVCVSACVSLCLCLWVGDGCSLPACALDGYLREFLDRYKDWEETGGQRGSEEMISRFIRAVDEVCVCVSPCTQQV